MEINQTQEKKKLKKSLSTFDTSFSREVKYFQNNKLNLVPNNMTKYQFKEKSKNNYSTISQSNIFHSNKYNYASILNLLNKKHFIRNSILNQEKCPFEDSFKKIQGLSSHKSQKSFSSSTFFNKTALLKENKSNQCTLVNKEINSYTKRQHNHSSQKYELIYETSSKPKKLKFNNFNYFLNDVKESDKKFLPIKNSNNKLRISTEKAYFVNNVLSEIYVDILNQRMTYESKDKIKKNKKLKMNNSCFNNFLWEDKNKNCLDTKRASSLEDIVHNKNLSCKFANNKQKILYKIPDIKDKEVLVKIPSKYPKIDYANFKKPYIRFYKNLFYKMDYNGIKK